MKPPRWRTLAATLALGLMGPAWLALGGGSAVAETLAPGVTCQDDTWKGAPYVRCDVDLTRADLRLFHTRPDGRIWGQFPTIEAALNRAGQRLVFAMNAGMYHQDRSPVGLYVEAGRETAPLITADGPGNFGLLPNGVFCFGDGRAQVVESRAFAAARPDCRFASQSGPMLVIAGALHPRFLRASTSRFTRNGVGVGDGGRRAVFVIADEPVTFHEFGTYFRDRLGLRDALYFDGNVSRLWLPAVGRRDFGFALGPVVGVTAPR
ncbi:MAG: phosphodiester glycosidase family protein [Pseudomonadota bacterium]